MIVMALTRKYCLTRKLISAMCKVHIKLWKRGLMFAALFDWNMRQSHTKHKETIALFII